MAAVTISEIQKSRITFANSQELLDAGIRNRMNEVENFITYSQR